MTNKYINHNILLQTPFQDHGITAQLIDFKINGMKALKISYFPEETFLFFKAIGCRFDEMAITKYHLENLLNFKAVIRT